jgi:hypothetical protein
VHTRVDIDEAAEGAAFSILQELAKQGIEEEGDIREFLCSLSKKVLTRTAANAGRTSNFEVPES